MRERRALRFLVEALFLGALAAALVFTDLEPLAIAGVMLVGWLVVALFEWAATRELPHYGRGLPPRYYVPEVSLPPPRQLEQLRRSGYPRADVDDAATWIAPASMREAALADWPVGPLPPPTPGEDTMVVELPPLEDARFEGAVGEPFHEDTWIELSPAAEGRRFEPTAAEEIAAAALVEEVVELEVAEAPVVEALVADETELVDAQPEEVEAEAEVVAVEPEPVEPVAEEEVVESAPPVVAASAEPELEAVVPESEVVIDPEPEPAEPEPEVAPAVAVAAVAVELEAEAEVEAEPEAEVIEPSEPEVAAAVALTAAVVADVDATHEPGPEPEPSEQADAALAAAAGLAAAAAVASRVLPDGNAEPDTNGAAVGAAAVVETSQLALEEDEETEEDAATVAVAEAAPVAQRPARHRFDPLGDDAPARRRWRRRSSDEPYVELPAGPPKPLALPGSSRREP